MKLGIAVFLFALVAAPVRGDLLMDLESGNFSALEAMRSAAESQGRTEEEKYARILERFYRGDLSGAADLAVNLSSGSVPSSGWLKSYLSEVPPLVRRMREHSSDHFIVRTDPDDAFLAEDALSALEKAYREIGSELGAFPAEKIPVEIYRAQEDFIAASTLSKETLERSGAIGICKFRRLMILSPENMAFGYRWLDTLAHEYTHYLVNVVSAGKCPLWLHEGIAKHFETRWRLKNPQPLTPGSRTELVRALRDGSLIPFSRMEPSMVYLENQEQVRLAFSEVAHAAGTVQRTKDQGLRRILSELAAGKSRDEAFQSVWGKDMGGFEADWKKILADENLKESPGSAPDILALGRRDEIEVLAGTGIRGHLRLGDRMRLSGRPEAAVVQYQRALDQEPDNPVALVKMARTLLALGREHEAEAALVLATGENPNYAPAFLLLGARQLSAGDHAAARFSFEEAIALNPFNPEARLGRAQALQSLGEPDLARREREIAEVLSRRNR
jgi:tetratricopeptide (TPR) repeat protein